MSWTPDPKKAYLEIDIVDGDVSMRFMDIGSVPDDIREAVIDIMTHWWSVENETMQ